MRNVKNHFRLQINKIRFDISQHRPVSFNSNDCEMFEETLDVLALVDAAMLKNVTLQLKSSTCSLDPIPTTLYKGMYGFCEGGILDIVNCSLQEGIFPACLKTAMVRTILKKSNLNPSVLNNY